VQAGT